MPIEGAYLVVFQSSQIIIFIVFVVINSMRLVDAG